MHVVVFALTIKPLTDLVSFGFLLTALVMGARSLISLLLKHDVFVAVGFFGAAILCVYLWWGFGDLTRLYWIFENDWGLR